MTLQEPENVHPDHPAMDSGVHVRDTESAPATGWQVTMVAALVVAILCVFFYGLNSQRQEVAGASAPAQQAANNVPPQKPATTGQGQAPDAKNPPGATRQQAPQKGGGQNAAQPATAPQKNQ